MKILIVTFWFPPANVIGAIRVGKLARYLDRRGHDLRVLTPDLAIEDRSMPLEIPAERVIYTQYRGRSNWLYQTARRLIRGASSATARVSGGRGAVSDGARRGSLSGALRRHYLALIHFPDMRVGWIKTAILAGSRLIERWRPDIIFASAPPHTGLVVASRLGRRFGIPWVADLRDLWVDNPYYSEPGWRKPVDAFLEHRTLKGAARLVTVSPVWAEQLRKRHGKPVEVVYNGYAMEDFPASRVQQSRDKGLTIRYMGSIYPGFRDPSAVFAAIRLLPDSLRNRVIVEFFCDAGDTVLAAAAAAGVTGAVIVRPLVPYQRALELQMQADVLLLLQSTERRDEGNIPAKLFEYFYSRRPILFIGYEHGVAARLVRERGAGLVSNRPQEICQQLEIWMRDKEAGRLGALDPSVCLGLSRDEQYRRLEAVFGEIAHETCDNPNDARHSYRGDGGASGTFLPQPRSLP
jgi:glycosyltransferase involved in cell wall biosynthesis